MLLSLRIFPFNPSMPHTTDLILAVFILLLFFIVKELYMQVEKHDDTLQNLLEILTDHGIRIHKLEEKEKET